MYAKERSLDATSTWAVAVVCLVLVSISLLLEHGLLAIGKWLKDIRKPALVGALEKIKTELMLMGFISLLLTVGQGPISNICISPRVSETWLPCTLKAKDSTTVSKLVIRRGLAEAPIDKCSKKGKVAFVSAYGIHQLHYFIFVLAVTHVVYCITTYILGRTKMKTWGKWEEETKNMDLRDYNDPERFRVAKDTSFGRRHLQSWSSSQISLWLVSFFRQFIGSVTKVDYRTLRHGFIMAHFPPGSESSFDFQKYINRTLEDDFTEVVEINHTMWLVALFFFLVKTNGMYYYLWLPFLPLILTLVVGTKLQVIITQMGLKIQEGGEMVQGALVVQPEDDLFWFGRPRFLLFLIHLILFQNAFQLSYFIWALWKFGINSCLHNGTASIVIKLLMGVITQVLCSYVTLPLYALVTQMGSTVRPSIFNDRIAEALRNWHRDAKKRAKESRHADSITQMSSAPGTASGGVSPAHSPRNSDACTASAPQSPRPSDFEIETLAPPTPASTDGLLYQGHSSSHIPYQVAGEGSKRSDQYAGEGSKRSDQYAGEGSKRSDVYAGEGSKRSDQYYGEGSKRTYQFSGEVSKRTDQYVGEVSKRTDQYVGEVSKRTDQCVGEVSKRTDQYVGEVSKRSLDPKSQRFLPAAPSPRSSRHEIRIELGNLSTNN